MLSQTVGSMRGTDLVSGSDTGITEGACQSTIESETGLPGWLGSDPRYPDSDSFAIVDGVPRH